MSNIFMSLIYNTTLKQAKKLRNKRFCIIFARKNAIATGRIEKAQHETIYLPSKFLQPVYFYHYCCRNGMKLENCQYISVDININNLNQPINFRVSQWKHEYCLFSTQETGNCFITTLNEELSN